MEMTASRTMQHRVILDDFASPDAQIAMETSIIGCRIARLSFSVTGFLVELKLRALASKPLTLR